MPLYEYSCPLNHTTERLCNNLESAPEEVPCSCGEPAHRIVSAPNFYLPWACAQMTGKEMLEGTPLADDDGRDNPYYKSTRTQVDFSK